ncbi:MAG: penicillin acylase family protein [Reichenbachiella sp.]
MKVVRFLFALVLTISFFSYVNFKQGEIPPLANFLNPFMGFWQNGESERLDVSEELSAEYLKENVTIKFDEQLIPHIFAKNDRDLYFAQGYMLAYHRLWQMDFQIIATEGRVSEVIGGKALEYDKLQRRKGLKYAAKRSLKTLEKDPEILAMMNAYTAGVNYWIDELSYKHYPVEYKLLGYAPKPWTNLKTAMLLKYMADMLSSDEKDLENTNALKLLGMEEFEMLFPETYDDIDPVIPSERKWDFTPLKTNEEIIKPVLDFTAETFEKPDPRHGSNNFVIDQRKSANGHVMLANEPDLSLNLPSIWYVMQLNAPGINVFGATLPGAPGIIVGFNDSIAWGVTNAKRDVVDWYKINFRDKNREEYQYDDKWLKTEKVIEKIVVRDGDTVYDTIIHTHYGPVVYDDNFLGKDAETNYAMKWTAHEESKDLRTFYELNRAKNYNDYYEALKHYRAPAQNFAFGSASGDIALWVNGAFPIKSKQQGKFLLDGANSRHEWQGMIPHDHKASMKNPTKGFLSSANQHPVDSTYPYYAYDYNYEFYRNRRINDRMNTLNSVTVDDMKELQHDNYNYRASESLPMMINVLDTTGFNAEQRIAYMMLRKWDYFNEADRQAPSYYEAWWDDLYAKIWDEMDDSKVALIKPHVFNTIYLMNNDSTNKYFDIQSTSEVEDVFDLINSSFREGVDKITEWKSTNESKSVEWYRYKNTKVTHLLKLASFSVDGVKVGGNRNIVNAASGTHGPSWRMVVELDPAGVKAWGVYPGSQSGNPGNPSYGEMIDDWASGKYYPLNFLKSSTEPNEHIIFTQTLEVD